jgi:hypothetical protein
MREFGYFLLAIAVAIAVLSTIDPGASSPRQPPPMTNLSEPRG